MLHAYYIARVPNKSGGESRRGYLTHSKQWREFGHDEPQKIDILPALFTDPETAHLWVMRNKIRTYTYIIKDVELKIFTLLEGRFEDATIKTQVHEYL